MDKAGLRAVYTAKRKELSEEGLRTACLDLAGQLASWLPHHSVNILHAYLPALGKNEVDTRIILGQIRLVNPGISIAVPRMEPGARKLTHYFYTPATPLILNRYGIPEPDPRFAEVLAPEAIDMVLVPLLAFDESGYRVGYGGGFYDVFLNECRPSVIKAGLSVFPPVKKISDVAPFDVRLDYCFTPDRVWSW